MTVPESPRPSGTCPVAHGAPNGIVGPRVPLYAPEFAADPHRAYDEMRQRYGSLVPVDLAPGLPATLVIRYHTAVRILNDPEHFSPDPRTWQKNVPADCPVLPLLGWRPTASKNTGVDYFRYRQATTSSIDEADLHALHAIVGQIAIPHINSFCEAGSADIISQYVFPVVFDAVNSQLGCPPDIGQRAATALATVFEGVDAEAGNAMLSEALIELVTSKRAHPGNDITSRLVQHSAQLDDVEVLNQIVGIYAGACELQLNLIANALLPILTDERFAGGVLGGSLSTRDALDEVLFNDPPLANLCVTFPRQPLLVDDVWLPAHQPVVISMAGCNNDPEIRTDSLVGNRSHLAWGLGPHACPARSMSYLIAQDAIDQLLDALPELELAGEITWRPGPIHRALAGLPVQFPPSAPFTVL
ncbi:cytochrome P450 [Nocardia sp. NPDC049220]|uniref:cytochrome P450 n=1 Tax=Nocardia sp. NPDC049220 TaxID=3155273 RepID=UPI0033C19FAE